MTESYHEKGLLIVLSGPSGVEKELFVLPYANGKMKILFILFLPPHAFPERVK